MVTTNRDDVAEQVKILRNQGMRRRYHHDELGWNARMDGFQGAVLTIKLKYIGAWNETRCELAARYGRLFARAKLAENGPVSGEWVGWCCRINRRDCPKAFIRNATTRPGKLFWTAVAWNRPRRRRERSCAPGR